MALSNLQVFHRFYPYILPYRRLVLLNLLTVLSIGILGIVSPLIFRVLFNDVFPAKNIKLLIYLVLMAILIEVLREVLVFVKGHGDAIVSNKVQHDLRRDVFNDHQRLKLDHFGDYSSGDHIWRLTNDVGRVQEMIASNIPTILQTLLEFSLLLLLSVWLDWQLSLVALSVIPFILISDKFSAEKLRLNDQLARESESQVTSFLRQNLAGVEEVKVNNQEGDQVVKYMRIVGNKIRAEYKGKNLFSLGTLVNQSVVKIWYWVINGFAAYHLIVSEISFGDYIAITTYLLRLFGPLHSFNSVYQSIVWQLDSGRRLVEFLDPAKGDAVSSVKRGSGDLSGDIVFHDVSFKYKDYLPLVLNGFNLRIPSGQKVAIVGPIGCGKTTLVKLILKLYKPGNGYITIQKKNIEQVDTSELRRKVGVVMQRPFIFNETILNNIRIGRKGATEGEVVDILKLMGVHDYFLEFESGLSKKAGEDGSDLSGGQKQLVAIARAYLKQPDVLIFDEATASLDSFTEVKVTSALRKLMEGRTTIMIAHRLSSIKNVDRILYMKDGRIIEDGTLEELIKLKGNYYRLYSEYYGERVRSSEPSGGEAGPQGSNARVWDFEESSAIRNFKGNVKLTKNYGSWGELEVDLAGCSGYCAKVCIADFPKEHSGKVLKRMVFDLYIPERTMSNIKGYFAFHLISSSPGLEWNELEKRGLNPGWNYFAIDIKRNGDEYLKGVKELNFVFNSSEILDGPVYITNPQFFFAEGARSGTGR